MDAAPHVLDLDVPQPGGDGADAVGGRERFEALAVADVEGQAEHFRRGVAQFLAEVVEVGDRGEEVAGFGFDGERDTGVGRGVENRAERVGEPLPRDVRRGVVRADTAEAVHGVGTEVGGDVDGADQETYAVGPALRVGIEEGGAMFVARVEDVAGAGLDGDGQAEAVERAGHLARAGGEIRGEGVEVHVVEGQADAGIAEVGEEIEGMVETEVGEAVGAVAEAEGGGRGAGWVVGWEAAGWGLGLGAAGWGAGRVLLGWARVRVRVVPGGGAAHVTLTFRANFRAAGARAAVHRAVPMAPARAARAAWSGIMARIPPPTARWVRGGEGLRTAWKRGLAPVPT